MTARAKTYSWSERYQVALKRNGAKHIVMPSYTYKSDTCHRPLTDVELEELLDLQIYRWAKANVESLNTTSDFQSQQVHCGFDWDGVKDDFDREYPPSYSLPDMTDRHPADAWKRQCARNNPKRCDTVSQG